MKTMNLATVYIHIHQSLGAGTGENTKFDNRKQTKRAFSNEGNVSISNNMEISQLCFLKQNYIYMYVSPERKQSTKLCFEN